LQAAAGRRRSRTGSAVGHALPAEERPHLTDLGNAQRLVEFHGDDLRYVAAWRKWLVWDGTRWAVDDTGEVYRRAEEAVRLMYREASLMQDSGDRKKLSGWARQSEAKKRIDNMIALAQFQPGIAITPDDLDNDIWLLNAQNGTVDLRTGHLRTHNRDDLITKLAPVHYDPNAECPTFKAFLERVLPSEDLRRFVQRAVGYSLTGDVSERALFILHGTGKNGKSTLLETIRAALGDYALQTPAETLMAKSAGGIPNDVARLKGSRFVSASETEAGHRLAESTVKQLTGNDTISARFMRAEWFDFRPTHKIFLATNHRPEIRGTDNAIWDRIKLVPFDVRIPASEQDPRLLETPKGELPGILRWAVEGCIEWQRGGLEPPVEVQMATDTYRADMDPLAQFIDDCLVYSRDAVTPSSLIWNRYLSWAEENYERPVNRRIFTDRLKAEDGFEPLEQSVWVGGKKQRAWKGVDVVREIANAA
jgi:putative DNA primase/helicase